MSRRSVLITVRKRANFFNLSNLNNEFYLFGSNFLKTFSQLLLKKNVLFINGVFNSFLNTIFLSGHFFFTTKILKNYKRETTVRSNNLLKSKKQILELSITNLLKSLSSKFKTNLILSNFGILNTFYNRKLVSYLFKKFKPYVFILFRRRFNLYIDFLKLTSLYFISKIDIGTYLYVITGIFRYLQKKSHAKFLTFLDQLIRYAIFISKKKLKISRILGLKLIINGRFKGKTRSNSTKLQIGSVPSQSINKNIEYSKRYTFTKKFGVFGFKMWVYKS